MDPAVARQTLQQHGLRATRSRVAILQVLGATSEHLRVTEVHQRARRFDAGVGLASVYRTMDLLMQKGLVKHVHMDHRHRHYASITEPHSHHLVCTGCGLAVEIFDCRLDNLARSIARRTDFEIDGHCMEFFGRCQECRRHAGTHSFGKKRKP